MNGRVLALGAAGLTAVVAVFVVLGTPVADTLQLVGITAGAGGGAGLAGGALLRAFRRSSLVVQAVAVALVTVGAVAAGALAAGRAMFLSTHDVEALTVVVLAAGVVGVTVAIGLGQRLAADSQALSALARELDGERSVRSSAPPEARELARLARELEDTAARLAEARERERALERSRRELIAWVSHDLRTPLAGLRATAEALEDGLAADEATRAVYHRRLREQADRLAELVDDLFELSRIQAGAPGQPREELPLADLVSDAVAAAAPVAAACGVRLQGHAHTEVAVQASPREIGRVLSNLLDNAIRASAGSAAATVRVSVDATGGAGVVRVQDSCGGIPEALLASVFEPGVTGQAAAQAAAARAGARASTGQAAAGGQPTGAQDGSGANARTPGGGGSGLGLAIARGLVEDHGGSLQVWNVDGGCCFEVRLPTR